MQNEQLVTTLICVTIGLAIVVIVLSLFIMSIKFLAGTASKLDLVDPLTGKRYRDVVDERGELLESTRAGEEVSQLEELKKEVVE